MNGPQWSPLMFAGPHSNLPLATTAEVKVDPRTSKPMLVVHYEIANGSISLPFDVEHAKGHVAMLQTAIAEAEKLTSGLTIAKELPPQLGNGKPPRAGWGN